MIGAIRGVLLLGQSYVKIMGLIRVVRSCCLQGLNHLPPSMHSLLTCLVDGTLLVTCYQPVRVSI